MVRGHAKGYRLVGVVGEGHVLDPRPPCGPIADTELRPAEVHQPGSEVARLLDLAHLVRDVDRVCARIPLDLRRKGRQIAVIYGDCGTGGEIDAFLEREGLTRIPGPHCYEMFLGTAEFDAEMEDQIGTFFLTDYMVRHFERIVMQGMGLRAYPQLRDMYFGNYTRALYIAQTDDEGLRQKARRAADELGLTYDYRFTGYGAFPDFVADAITASTSQTSQQKQRR